MQKTQRPDPVFACAFTGLINYSNRFRRVSNQESITNDLRPSCPFGLATIPCMDYLWSPWRYAYITGDEPQPGSCIFCDKPKESDDVRNLIVHRGQECFVILNAFPYTSGHVMIVPYQHTDELQKLSSSSATEMMALTQRLEGVLRLLYRPDGINLGMNIGKAAGAGIAGHLHMHILPRWTADANFISVIGETRVLPEALDTTYKRIKEALG